jgi:ribose transport system ATP-binding protein
MELSTITLSMTNVSKAFPGVLALDSVSFELQSAEVLCILGENGAGKSTLLNILAGAYKRDSGEIQIFGRTVNYRNPREAIADGIAVIYQELNYVNNLTVAENIFLERQPIEGLLRTVNWEHMFKDAQEILNQIGANINSRADMSTLSVAEKQLVEIAKAMSQDMKILVTDEPTSALNANEVRTFFGVIKALTSRDVSVIFISHRIEEVMEISDRVLVLRDGKTVGLVNVVDVTSDQLVTLMVGRQLEDIYPTKRRVRGDVLLEASDLYAQGLTNINFALHQGEVIAAFGLLGSGLDKLGSVLFGCSPLSQGKIFVRGQETRIKSPSDAIESKITFLPSERRVDGLVLGMNVAANISLISMLLLRTSVLLNFDSERKHAANWVNIMRIKTPSLETEVKALSGGNQQKVVLSKCLDSEPDVLIFSEPTRGIDVGAKAEIYELMEDFCARGGGILLISSDLEEVMGMSDAVIVMHDGGIISVLERAEATNDVVMNLAVGGDAG